MRFFPRILISALVLISGIQPSSAMPIYVFPVADCAVKYTRFHHDYPATDIQAKKGCAFVAPINGIVEDVNLKDIWSGKTNLGQDRGGLSVSIIGDDGVRYYGSHLKKIADGIEVGSRVEVGTLLGYVGDTGDARGTAPHVHFGISWPTTERDIWWVRRGVVFPWRYLDKWKVGLDRSPATEVKALLAKSGEIPAIPKK